MRMQQKNKKIKILSLVGMEEEAIDWIDMLAMSG